MISFNFIRSHLLLIALILMYSSALVVTAWITEDAYITFRTVDNFVSGFGLTWNISERVQSFTHPLWMFLLSAIYFFTHEIYYSSIAVSFFFSIAAISIFAFRLSSSLAASVAGVFALTFSKAFVEYSTSGLENPLSHFILVLFLLLFFRKQNKSIRDFFILCLIASFSTLNRMDTILIYLPALLFYYTGLQRIRGLFAALLALTPLFLWEVFSLFYYGSFFPNTAYAKLNTGIRGIELATQGLYYFLDSLILDPITLTVIFIGMIMPAIKKDWKNFMLSIGVFLYLIYIVKIGGDFMSGRFFTIPLFCSVAILSRYTYQKRKLLIPVILLLAAGISSAQIPILSGYEYGANRIGIVNQNGISDERRAYYPHVGLLKSIGKTQWPNHRWAVAGRKARLAIQSLSLNKEKEGPSLYQIGTTVGLYGYFAGPHVHIIDKLSLCDPFLARLPAVGSEWRPGHFERDIPDGYIESLVFNENKIANKNLARYYDKLNFIITAPLYDSERIYEIWNMNAGKHAHLIDSITYHEIHRFKEEENNRIASRLYQAVNKNSNDSMRYTLLFHQLGQIYKKEGSFKEAERQYKIALAINPLSAQSIHKLAVLYAETGRTEQAIAQYKKLRKLTSKNPEIDYNIACLYARQNKKEEAVAWLIKAIDKGYKNWGAIKQDKDLENIHSSAEYKKIMEQKKAGGTLNR